MTDHSWVSIPAGSGFGLANLPMGVFRPAPGSPARVGTRIGEHVLDLAAASAVLAPEWTRLFESDSLNAFLGSGRETWRSVRSAIRTWLSEPIHAELLRPHLSAARDASMLLPFAVADYVDFYSSEHHARNVGRLFRPNGDPLTPNWKHLPIGYHGRAGTVVVSGTPITRPRGQLRPDPDEAPIFGPSRRLDIEAEVGFVVGTPSALGTSVTTSRFADFVFGICLVNDWSARDIQAFEYVPLGPFLGKSFATSISPWIIPLDALTAARTAPPVRDLPLLDYLRDDDEQWALDIELEIGLNGEVISRPPFRQMYWTAAQQLAHLTVNGASLRVGDFFASGTVSGPNRDERGSLLELSWGGSEPIPLRDGSTRSFLLDGDEIEISATAPGVDGHPISFGSVVGAIRSTGHASEGP